MLLTNEIMEKMDARTQREVLEAMLDELTERRGVQDPELFKRCFIEEAPDEGATYIDWINDFGPIARIAFHYYHKARKAARDAEQTEAPVTEAEAAESADPAPGEEQAAEE